MRRLSEIVSAILVSLRRFGKGQRPFRDCRPREEQVVEPEKSPKLSVCRSADLCPDGHSWGRDDRVKAMSREKFETVFVTPCVIKAKRPLPRPVILGRLCCRSPRLRSAWSAYIFAIQKVLKPTESHCWQYGVSLTPTPRLRWEESTKIKCCQAAWKTRGRVLLTLQLRSWLEYLIVAGSEMFLKSELLERAELSRIVRTLKCSWNQALLMAWRVSDSSLEVCLELPWEPLVMT